MKNKKIYLILLTIIVLLNVFTILYKNSNKKPKGMQVGETGYCNNFEFTLNDVKYEKGANDDTIKIVNSITIKNNSENELTYSPNYLLWYEKDNRPPYENTNGWSNGDEYIFNQDSNVQHIKATFEVPKDIFLNKKTPLLLVLANDVKYSFDIEQDILNTIL